MALLAMARFVRNRISHIPGRVVSWVFGRRVRATIGDTRLSRGLKQAIFNTETERGTQSATEKERMVPRARRCWLHWRAIHAEKIIVPASLRTAVAAVLLCGPLCTSFCLCGQNRLLAADRKPPVGHGFRHGSRQRRSIAQLMCESGKACPGRHRGTVLEQVAGTSQIMTKLQLYQPDAVILGCRLIIRRVRCGDAGKQAPVESVAVIRDRVSGCTGTAHPLIYRPRQ